MKKEIFIAFIINVFLLSNCTPGCKMESLEIVTRNEWGAIEPNLQGSEEGLFDANSNLEGWLIYQEPLSKVLRTIVIHHSALPISDGPQEIQSVHMSVRGYDDIAYHFVIDAQGVIYEGRELNVRGAHTGGFNTGSVGIVLLGNFEQTEPTDAQIDSLKKLSCSLREEYGLSHIAGHRDFQPDITVCPGENLYAVLPGIAGELKMEYGTGGYVVPDQKP
ncbi:MAG: N-acetylmuramoyl-L-alanine amidase [Anaerolineaceae bacterium]|nr:N-acetylmuramoyl-L-alanine amidase [Anaerolineaceae bacterium]